MIFQPKTVPAKATHLELAGESCWLFLSLAQILFLGATICKWDVLLRLTTGRRLHKFVTTLRKVKILGRIRTSPQNLFRCWLGSILPNFGDQIGADVINMLLTNNPSRAVIQGNLWIFPSSKVILKSIFRTKLASSFDWGHLINLSDELVQEVRLLRAVLGHLERPQVLLSGRQGAGPREADGLRWPRWMSGKKPCLLFLAAAFELDTVNIK